jgi:alpha-ketoglutarate-dependent taurine dioxygenase
MQIKKINNGVAVEVSDIDITTMTEGQAQELYNILKQRLVVVLKNQKQCPGSFAKTIWLMSKQINNWRQMKWDQYGNDIDIPEKFIDPTTFENPEFYPVQRVTGKKINNKHTGIFGTGTLDWHANLNGLDRADGVALQGVRDCENTSTLFLNTNLALRDLDPIIIEKIKNLYAIYEYRPDVWAAGAPEYKHFQQKSQEDTSYKMWVLQKNIAGVEGLYFYTNNRCELVTEDNHLKQTLIDHLFQEKYIYEHSWMPGDIVLMDQLLTLHKRGTDDPDVLSKRILHRITFPISNVKNFIANNNQIP